MRIELKEKQQKSLIRNGFSFFTTSKLYNNGSGF